MVPLTTIVRQWGRIGVTGFGGPPTHIALLRKLCVDQEGWLTATEFEDGVAATNMLPGPASTQLAIFCAWRLRGRIGALVGGLCFIAPGLLIILGLSAVFLAAHPPRWIEGASAGAGAAVAAVALHASTAWPRPAGGARPGPGRPGSVGSSTCWPERWRPPVRPLARPRPPGLWGGRGDDRAGSGRTGGPGVLSLLPAVVPAVGGSAALVWVALKVGALSYGGGFVIVPLMQHDAVTTYHWMTATQFLNAVALGQVTPGPVVQTVAVVGYAAGGLGGGAARRPGGLRPVVSVRPGRRPPLRPATDQPRVQAFLTGAGASAVGAIAGAAVPLGLALVHQWQVGVLGLAAVWLLVLRRGVVSTLLGAGLLGVIAVMAGAPA